MSEREQEIQFSDQPLHEAFTQQIKELLDSADLTEEQKQEILIALQCPCCGSGGVSLTIKLKK
jgi:hypothetical protein